MKKFLLILLLFMSTFALADTETINWVVDGETYDTTTCTVGGILTVPNPAPTKYGYTFVGWRFDEIFGSGSQSGTPSPTNPIEPTFTPFVDTVLRAVGSGANAIADSYNPITNTITRRVGVKVLDGTENWSMATTNVVQADVLTNNTPTEQAISSHLVWSNSGTLSGMADGSIKNGTAVYTSRLYVKSNTYATDATIWEQYLVAQYTAGTPVTVYYPLATPVEERAQ